MVAHFFYELLNGFLRLWINPVFYMALLLAVMLGIQRVKKERALFHFRVFDSLTDVYSTVVPGLITGIVLSVFFLGVGFMLSAGTIVLLMTVTFILSLAFRPNLLTPSFVILLAVFVVFFLPDWDTSYPMVNQWIQDIQGTSIPHLFLLLSVLMFAEAFLILFQANRWASPRRMTSKRGRVVGGFETKRIWLVPTFLLVPGLGIERIDWWPIFGLGESFRFLLVPFLIGFRQFQTYTLPKQSTIREGKLLTIVAIVSLAASVLSVFYDLPSVAVVGIVLSFAMRIFLFYLTKKANHDSPFRFTERNNGVMVLSIIPKTPASEMNLKAGEIIRKVNGISIRSAAEFYQALQQSNAAFCKLEVIDENGEMRFEQRALYHDEHHELGLIFVDESREFN